MPFDLNRPSSALLHDLESVLREVADRASRAKACQAKLEKAENDLKEALRLREEKEKAGAQVSRELESKIRSLEGVCAAYAAQIESHLCHIYHRMREVGPLVYVPRNALDDRYHLMPS